MPTAHSLLAVSLFMISQARDWYIARNVELFNSRPKTLHRLGYTFSFLYLWMTITTLVFTYINSPQLFHSFDILSDVILFFLAYLFFWLGAMKLRTASKMLNDELTLGLLPTNS